LTIRVVALCVLLAELVAGDDLPDGGQENRPAALTEGFECVDLAGGEDDPRLSGVAVLVRF
jgi:hypothetical protein